MPSLMAIMRFMLRHALIYQAYLIGLTWVSIKTAPLQYKQPRSSIQSRTVAITAAMLATLANPLSLTIMPITPFIGIICDDFVTFDLQHLYFDLQHL